MLEGDFYSSSGVMLDKLILGKDQIELSVNQKETACELASEFLFGRPVKKGEPGTYIEFIGPGGELVKSIKGFSGSCKSTGDYLRAKVVHRVQRKMVLCVNITLGHSPYLQTVVKISSVHKIFVNGS